MKPSPFELYEKAKVEHARLRQVRAGTSEWIRFSSTLLEWVMACQAVVMEKQKAAFDAARDGMQLAQVSELRTEAKDALYYVDQLTALYQRAKQHIV
jgi:hypothetical protein